MFTTKPCAACGNPTFETDMRDVHGAVAALLEVRDDAEVCRWCERDAERDLDAADDDAALAADPDFQTVCDARRDAWMAALEAETAAQWAAVVRVTDDVLDEAATI